jgi:hypothetical protein
MTLSMSSSLGCWESAAKKTYSPLSANLPKVDTIRAALPLPMSYLTPLAR